MSEETDKQDVYIALHRQLEYSADALQVLMEMYRPAKPRDLPPSPATKGLSKG